MNIYVWIRQRKRMNTHVGKSSTYSKGVTIIALIVTIIVLIILSGVCISLIFNKNGIINKAKQAKEEYERAQNREQEQLENIKNYIINTEGNKTQTNTNESPDGTPSLNTAKLITSTDGTKVNEPDISNFNQTVTYYVTWTKNELETYEITDTTLISETKPTEWCDYSKTNKKWANVKTAGNGNIAYWVWIPRYAYKVPTRSSTSETIEVKFLSGISDIPTDGTNITISNNTTPGSWNVHPAFQFGDKKLTGIWVAKFEASSSNPSAPSGGGNTTGLQVNVIPEVTSWRTIKITNALTVCRKMEQEGGTLELTSNALESNGIDSTENVDTHLMKNSEWGAVAYLSMSEYGKNGQVWNNSYGDTVNYITKTGRAGSTANAYTETEETTSPYNTGTGPQASTTGNVYGVYDMAGGAWECVAGYLSEVLEEGSSFIENIENFRNVENLHNADIRYKDKYIGNSDEGTTNYGVNSAKYGDAVYETSSAGNVKTSWYNSYSYFPKLSSPIFVRGGIFCHQSGVGVFAFNCHTGSNGISYGFRPVLVFPQ